MVVNIMSKEQEQNINIKSFIKLVDQISSGENKKVTIFDLASAYAAINYHITYHLDNKQKADLQEYLTKKYTIDDKKSLSEVIDIITDQAIDKAIANNYQITFQDIDNAISQLPENLAIKIINSINNDIEENENVNLALNDRCTTEILKSLVDKGFSIPKDSIVNLMNKKMDDVVYGKINYLLSLKNIKYDTNFDKCLIGNIVEEILQDEENFIANYAKYEDVLLKIKDKLKINLLDDFKTQISKIEEVQNFAQDVLKQKIDEFNKYSKEEKDANYLKIVLELHHLDIITNSDESFISEIRYNCNNQYCHLVLYYNRNYYITRLNFSRHEIGDDGAKALAEALKDNKTITVLYLSGNKIGNAGAIAIADMLKVNTTITKLYLYNNNIGIEGVKAIARILEKNEIITELDLSFNVIGNDGAKALAEALKENKIIKEINLNGNAITDDGVIALGRACVGKEIEVEFGGDEKNDLFKKAQKYGNKQAENSYFFNIPAAATGIFTASTIITLATIITLSILASQGIIGFDSAAFIAPIASVGAINLVTFIGFAITEFVSKVMDYKNISEYNQFHKNDGLAKKQTLLQVLNPCHKVQFVDKVLSEQNNNEKTPLIEK
jgi:hypothetical protein